MRHGRPVAVEKIHVIYRSEASVELDHVGSVTGENEILYSGQN